VLIVCAAAGRVDNAAGKSAIALPLMSLALSEAGSAAALRCVAQACKEVVDTFLASLRDAA